MDMDDNSTEDHMYGINWQFPATSGYITRPQDRHGQFGGEGFFPPVHTFCNTRQIGGYKLTCLPGMKIFANRMEACASDPKRSENIIFLDLEYNTWRAETYEVAMYDALGQKLLDFKPAVCCTGSTQTRKCRQLQILVRA